MGIETSLQMSGNPDIIKVSDGLTRSAAWTIREKNVTARSGQNPERAIFLQLQV